MKKLLTALAISLAASTASFAADAIVDEVVVVETAYDWSGVYVGAQAGGSWANIEQNIPAYGSLPDGDASGWLVGAYVGYYAQLSSVVVGAELGANWRDVDGTSSIDNDPERFAVEQKWDASLVAKVGVPLDNVLLYGLVGAAVTELEGNYTPGSDKGSDTVWGWTVGAGAEVAFNEKIRGRLEYRFADYSDADVACGSCGSTSMEPQTHSVAAGISYGF